MERPISALIEKDLQEKIVFLSGPRQVGKTTVAKTLFPQCEYLNYDSARDRKILLSQTWNRNSQLIIFDELHKMRSWKSFIKGIFDTEGVTPNLLVTGSARLDIYRKGSDSLAGRFHSHRLYPFSVAELATQIDSEEVLDRILRFGGFPEPFLKDSEQAAKRWRRSHLDSILREDLLDLEKVREVHKINLLVELLAQNVGSTVSYASLARSLEVSPHTVKHWIGILEKLYIIFTVLPYSRNISRALLKEPKIYFFDTGFIPHEPGYRLENAVANALLKHLHFLEDTQGERCSLHYLRDKQKREVDFVLVVNQRPTHLIEVKWQDTNVSQLNYFAHFFDSNIVKIQLVKDLKRELTIEKSQVTKASQWLKTLAN